MQKKSNTVSPGFDLWKPSAEFLEEFLEAEKARAQALQSALNPAIQKATANAAAFQAAMKPTLQAHQERVDTALKALNQNPALEEAFAKAAAYYLALDATLKSDSETKPAEIVHPKLKTSNKRGRKPDRLRGPRWKIIREVHSRQPKLKGKNFWMVVQNEGGHPDFGWLGQKCPKSLSDAFDDPYWKKVLSRDKCDATRKLRK